MLVPIRMSTKMAAGNQQKHLSLSFAISVNSSLEELKNNTVLVFPMQELFRWPNFPKKSLAMSHFLTSSAVM